MQAMKKDDWVSLGTSVALHALLVLLFAFMSLGVSDPQPLGYIEVDFGPIAEGRPVQRTVEDQPEAPEPEEPEPEPEPEQKPEAAPPQESKPVDLPDQEEELVEEDQVTTPETETIAPETPNEPVEEDEPVEEPAPEPTPQPLGAGAEDGTTGADDGDAGPGTEERKTAPFQIEGLNRTTVYSEVPAYPVQVNADIKMRITVDPQGRIVRIFPLLKGEPALEQAVREALQDWRFNPLPPNAPRENQTGTITFRFRLE